MMKPSADSIAKPPRSRRGRVVLRTLDDLDGRTMASRRAFALVRAIEDDLGGSDRLATGEREIIKRSAVLGAMAEDLEARWLSGQEIDPGELCVLANCQRRLLEAVGLRRVPRNVTPSVAAYVAHLDAEDAA
jgi:hypothetical protein